MVADDLRVDPSELRMASDHLGVAAADHATETARHRDEFVDGVGRGAAGPQYQHCALWPSSGKPGILTASSRSTPLSETFRKRRNATPPPMTERQSRSPRFRSSATRSTSNE